MADYVRGPAAPRGAAGANVAYALRQIGWPLFRVARYVEWCGHGQELIPVPDEEEWVRMVPVIGRAK